MFCSDAAAGRREEGAGSTGKVEAVAAADGGHVGGRDGSGAATDDANESDVSEALINKLDEAKQQQQQQMTQFDVKIGAGMDIAIHGENGE